MLLKINNVFVNLANANFIRKLPDGMIFFMGKDERIGFTTKADGEAPDFRITEEQLTKIMEVLENSNYELTIASI